MTTRRALTTLTTFGLLLGAMLIAPLSAPASAGMPVESPTLSIGDITVPEGDSGNGSAAWVMIRMSEAQSSDVTVRYSTTDGTATGHPKKAGDYKTANNKLLTF